MMRLNKCTEALRGIGITSKAGRTSDETASAVCLAAQVHKDYDPAVGVTPRLVGQIFSTQWAGLSLSVDGGITHFISVDNGGYYAELWCQGENWYAATGAKEDKQQGGIWQVPGVIQGMDARDVVPLFLKSLDEGAFGGLKKKKNCGC